VALYLAREEHGSGRAFTRVAFAWDRGELVIERAGDEALRLLVHIGDEREEHELAFHEEALRSITSRSKLIQIEEIGKAGALARSKKTVVNAQSKLIKIEETGASLPEATLVLP